MYLVFVNCNDQYVCIWFEQVFGQFQLFFYEGQLFVVLLVVVVVYIVVVVFLVVCVGVVGWVDVDVIYLIGIQVIQQLQCVVVVGFDQYVLGCVNWVVGYGIYWY